MNDILALLEHHATKDSCEINQMISKIKGSGARAATRMLYMRLVCFATNTSSDQRWIMKPTSTKRVAEVEDWLKDTSNLGICSSDLLIYFKASTYKDSLVFLVKEGLVAIDRFNKMHIKYPFDGKMLSLKYAMVAIKSSLKKPVEVQDEENKKECLDNGAKNGVSLDLQNIIKETNGDATAFWEKV